MHSSMIRVYEQTQTILTLCVIFDYIFCFSKTSEAHRTFQWKFPQRCCRCLSVLAFAQVREY